MVSGLATCVAILLRGGLHMYTPERHVYDLISLTIFVVV